MDPVEKILIFMILHGMQATETPDAGLALSHALIEEARILKLEKFETHTAYVDLSGPFAFLKTLKEEATKIKTHLAEDMTHLKSTSLYAMEKNGTYFTYFLSDGDYGHSKTEGCFLIGGEAFKPETAAGWKSVGDMVKEFNEANEGSTIPIVEKLLVPVRLDNSVSKLRYVGIGSKEILELDASIATRINLLKAGSAFPLYDIKNDQFVFRDSNTPPAHALCKVIRNQKTVQAPVWRTLVARKEVEIESLLEDIEEKNTFLLNLFGEFAAFTYTLGNKIKAEDMEPLDDLTNLITELGSHSAANVYDSGTYAIASVFLDRLVNVFRQKMAYYNNLFSLKTQILKRILTVVIRPLLTIVSNNLHGISNVNPFIEAFKLSIKATTTKYDPNAKVLLQEIQYYSPQKSDLLSYLSILKFPIMTSTFEVIVRTPYQHVITGSDTCQFVSSTFLLSHCKKLNENNFYSCQYTTGHQDECCIKLHELNTPDSIDQCETEFYEEPPRVARMKYEDYNAVFIMSATHERQIETVCDGGKMDHHLVNETVLIGTNCKLKYGSLTTPLTQVSRASTTITPLRSLFQEDITEAKSKKVAPHQPRTPHSPSNDNFEENNQYIFGLTLLEWGLISGGVVSLGTFITCALTTLFFGRRRYKRRRQTKSDLAKEQYIMANSPKRELLPIYSATAPPQQFI